jgi:hypothetical protein
MCILYRLLKKRGREKKPRTETGGICQQQQEEQQKRPCKDMGYVESQERTRGTTGSGGCLQDMKRKEKKSYLGFVQLRLASSSIERQFWGRLLTCLHNMQQIVKHIFYKAKKLYNLSFFLKCND